MRFRLVVFDLDGTLVDSSQDLAKALNLTLARIAPGVPSLSLAEVRSFIGDGARSLVRRSLEQAGVEMPADDVLPLFLQAYRGCLLETTLPYPGVVEALDQMRDRTLAVLTNKRGDMSRTILEGLGLAGRFQRIYGGGDVAGRKPDPAGLRRILEELQVAPPEALMVGDSGTDVKTGRNAGVATAGVTYGFDQASLAALPPDVLVGDLRELARWLQGGQSAG